MVEFLAVKNSEVGNRLDDAKVYLPPGGYNRDKG